MIGRVTVFVYGLVCYLILFTTFLYAVGFIGNLAVPKSIDLGPRLSLIQAMLIDGALLALVAFQHSMAARQWLKRFWMRLIPEPAERSTYVLLSSLVLLFLFWQWRPIDDIVWDIENLSVRIAIYAVYGLGWSTLAGSALLSKERQRHGFFLGCSIVFWATPTMTAGHLLFAIATTSYILVAIQFEEWMKENGYGVSFRRNQAWANRRSWRTT